jgi:hypothetical protein
MAALTVRLSNLVLNLNLGDESAESPLDSLRALGQISMTSVLESIVLDSGLDTRAWLELGAQPAHHVVVLRRGMADEDGLLAMVTSTELRLRLILSRWIDVHTPFRSGAGSSRHAQAASDPMCCACNAAGLAQELDTACDTLQLVVLADVDGLAERS